MNKCLKTTCYQENWGFRRCAARCALKAHKRAAQRRFMVTPLSDQKRSFTFIFESPITYQTFSEPR